MRKLTYTAALAAAMLLLCSCSSSKTGNPINSGIKTVVLAPTASETGESAALEITAETDKTDETAEGDTADTDGITSTETDTSVDAGPETETAAPAETAAASGENDAPETAEPPEWSAGLDDFYYHEYAAYHLDWDEREFTTQSLFVGDSICRGFREYHIVPVDNVYARGSIAARNFFDFNLYRGEDEEEYTQALAETTPRYVFLSMGMNDINLTDEETYCENYRKIIDTTLENSDAVVYVAAITPIDSDFSSNYRIDCFNLRMEKFIHDNYGDRVHYLDFAKHLKDSDGSLKECFNGGDGIHLSPYAYYVALWEMNRTTISDGVR